MIERSIKPLSKTSRLFLQRRPFSTVPRQLKGFSFKPPPAPPRLPKEEQEIFERLQRQSSSGGLSDTAVNHPRFNPVPQNNTSSQPAASREQQPPSGANIPGSEEGGLHRDLRPPLKSDFEGDVNPKTGEVGGPKNEPLRWGASGDWSYKGRVTDF